MGALSCGLGREAHIVGDIGAAVVDENDAPDCWISVGNPRRIGGDADCNVSDDDGTAVSDDVGIPNCDRS